MSDFIIQIQIQDLSETNQRLDSYLAKNFPDYSREVFKAALKNGLIRLNGELAKAKTLLKIGDQINGVIKQEEKTADQAQDLALEVIYSDEDLIVINKPAGLVCHPAAGNADKTLLNALLYHFPKTANLPRAGIIHRLDKDTTGLLVVAHSLKAHTHLIRQLQERTMGREYLALVLGEPTAGGTVNLAIGRHPKLLKMAIRPDGREAITHYRIEERFSGLTLLRVKLETGRTHQIRVHMAELKYPLVGDSLYGTKNLPKNLSETAKTAIKNFPRQALHAQKLSLIHPTSQEIISFKAELPEDLKNLIETIRISS